ncbi:DNA internalization-related competence protein ComEC/Rec2 [Eubacterium ventriosum]|uniref:DNA internalization-related competence protein ComEC/Rec2 n=1 Tax=Eubacterium ventriosum TaxID=39496 RepID=A0A413R8T0_9FIRM|nr:DNA internalization-related competence protein ComEC/Rec2 [Eubacterium ventriosum]RHB17493.1 DNA internalization-related competence protein ComEC/Rec2 [Eubacterium ventriosum]
MWIWLNRKINKKGVTVIKRPVFWILLAFVLGEVIAVFDLNIAVPCIVPAIIVIGKIVIKAYEDMGAFVVIFFTLIMGFMLMSNEITTRNYIYDLKENTVIVQGKIYKIENTAFGTNIYLKGVEVENGEKSVSVKRIFVNTEKIPNVKIGNIIKVRGKLRQFEEAANKGNFDSRKYYLSLGFYGKIEAGTIEIINSDYSGIRQGLYELRMEIIERLEKLCSDNNGIFSIINNKNGIIGAIILGDKTDIDSDIKELYSVSGIAHILAISGLHISFIGMAIYRLLRRRFRFLFSAAVSIPVVLSFGIMSGFGISTIRAIIMFILKIIGEVLGRKYDAITAISLAGLVLLVQNPFVVCNSGFQMSFGAIIAIVLILPIVEEILNTDNKIIKVISANFTISLVMNPILAWNYYELPTFSFLLNIVVVPLMSVVIVSSIAGIFCSCIMFGFGKVVIFPGCGILELYTFLCNIINKSSVASIVVGQPKVTIIIVYYAILLVVLFGLKNIRTKYTRAEKERNIIKKETGLVLEKKAKKERRIKGQNVKLRLACIVGFLLLNCLIYYIPNPGFYITFIDVGQGDGILIHGDNGTKVMVDGGSTSEKQVAKNCIVPYLKAEGIGTIDYSIITHTDKDHISGILEILENNNSNRIRIKNLVMPDINMKDDTYNELIEKAKLKKINVLYIKKGDTLSLGKTKIKCIYPETTTTASDKNDYCTVLSVKNKTSKILLTGDISKEIEEKIKDDIEENYTVLKVAHHGSNYSSSEKFLKKVNPKYSIISVGKNNSYGHPGNETMERLRKQGGVIYRTDEKGGITIR